MKNEDQHKRTQKHITAQHNSAQPTTIQDEKNESKLSLNEYQEESFPPSCYIISSHQMNKTNK